MSRWFTWKYDCDYLLDPKYYIWIFLIVGPFLLLFGSIGLIGQNRSTSKCTAVTYGVVMKVEEKQRTALHDIYVATVEPVDPGIFSGSNYLTGETDQAYEKGKYVEIHYDPSDSSTFYIEHEDPGERNFALLFSGGTLTLIGLIVLGFYKAYLKRNAVCQQ